MQKDTHIVGGLIAGSLLVIGGVDTLNKIPTINIENVKMFKSVGTSVLLLSTSVFGSLYPDVDHRGSYMGRRLVVISYFLNLLSRIARRYNLKKMKAWFSHRGISHSLITWVFRLFFINFILNIAKANLLDYLDIINLLQVINIGISFGAISHICLDFFNPGGVPLLMPITNKKFRIPIINVKTSSGGELVYRVFFILILIFIWYKRLSVMI